MAQQGATLQNYNNELVKCIEDLREKREEVNRQILAEEEEKAKIQKVRALLPVPVPVRVPSSHTWLLARPLALLVVPLCSMRPCAAFADLAARVPLAHNACGPFVQLAWPPHARPTCASGPSHTTALTAAFLHAGP